MLLKLNCAKYTFDYVCHSATIQTSQAYHINTIASIQTIHTNIHVLHAILALYGYKHMVILKFCTVSAVCMSEYTSDHNSILSGHIQRDEVAMLL